MVKTYNEFINKTEQIKTPSIIKQKDKQEVQENNIEWLLAYPDMTNYNQDEFEYSIQLDKDLKILKVNRGAIKTKEIKVKEELLKKGFYILNERRI
jgi:hypothetical protein